MISYLSKAVCLSSLQPSTSLFKRIVVNITRVHLLQLATSLPYASHIANLPGTAGPGVAFVSYNETFVQDIVGPNPSWSLISEQPYEAFHEAGVYHKPTNSMYISSNWAGDPSNPINITIYNLTDDTISSTRYDGLFEANGGTAYYGINGDENLLLFADEGDFTGHSALVTVDPSTGEARPLLNNFFSRNFSSLNDVRMHPSNGLIYFTDSFYGSDQDFRPPPTLPTQAYTFDPRSGVVKVIADGFVRANGVEISADGKTFYVSDTGYQLVSRQVPTAPASIYQYDIREDGTLGPRRLFAYVDSGVPDGIHVDTNDNVYSGCGDGVQVWNRAGTLLGKFQIDSSAANFAFLPGGMLIFNEYRLYKVNIIAEGREVKRDFGL